MRKGSPGCTASSEPTPHAFRYGALPGNATTTADAIKAYVKAFLKSNFQLERIAPRAETHMVAPKVCPTCSTAAQSAVLSPEAGGLWEQHLQVVLRQLRGGEIQEYTGKFWFPKQRLMLPTCVDDLTLSTPQEEHQSFWAELTSLVDVEPPDPVYRVLGRSHYVINAPAETWAR